jgi:hypothetical protein
MGFSVCARALLKMGQPLPKPASHLVAAEEVILFAGAAVRASQAADKEHSHAHRNQHGDHASVRRKPMNKVMHMQENLRS